GDLAAAVDVDHLGAVPGPFVVRGELPRGVDRQVLQQQERVRALPGDDLRMQAPLQIPGGAILDRARGQPELLVAVPTGDGFAESEAYDVEHRPRLLRFSPVRCG